MNFVSQIRRRAEGGGRIRSGGRWSVSGRTRCTASVARTLTAALRLHRPVANHRFAPGLPPGWTATQDVNLRIVSQPEWGGATTGCTGRLHSVTGRVGGCARREDRDDGGRPSGVSLHGSRFVPSSPQFWAFGVWHVGCVEGRRPIHSQPGKGDDVLCWAWRGLVAGGKAVVVGGRSASHAVRPGRSVGVP